MQTRTFTITIGTETREVEAKLVRDGFYMSRSPIGAYRKGNGRKVWADYICWFRRPDGEFVPQRTTTILNRRGYDLVGWIDRISETSASEHVGAIRGAGR